MVPRGITRRPSSTVRGQILLQKVCYLIDPISRQLDQELVQQVFNADVVPHILSIPIKEGVRTTTRVRWETVQFVLSEVFWPSICHPTTTRFTYRFASCRCLWAADLQMDGLMHVRCFKSYCTFSICRFQAFSLSVAFLSRSTCVDMRHVIVIPSCALKAAVFRLANPSSNSLKSGMKPSQIFRWIPCFAFVFSDF